jgi:hypothetical protein
MNYILFTGTGIIEGKKKVNRLLQLKIVHQDMLKRYYYWKTTIEYKAWNLIF